jgi:hypothetical protein
VFFVNVDMDGTYVAVKVLYPTLAWIEEYVRAHRIPQVHEDRQVHHATIIWSRRHCPNLKPEHDVVHRASVNDIHVFRSDGKNCLVLLLDAPTLVKRHNHLMKVHGATYDYPEFIPHVTIAYDIGDYHWWKLPKFEHDIILGDESVRPVNERHWQIRSPWKRIQKMLSEI